MSEQMIESKSETIGIADQRNLQKITHELGSMLTQKEYVVIAQVYKSAIERLFKENGLEL